MKRLIVGISGASGAIYGIRLLEVLRDMEDVETHLVMSRFARMNVEIETTHDLQYVEDLADQVHSFGNQAAPISSGSFQTDGMVIAPCSMKTLAAVAHAFADDLVSRAADVVLKERRRLVIMPRETPLTLAHLRNMVAASEMGAVVFPPVPAFYAKPRSVDQLVEHSVLRVLDLFGIHSRRATRWKGLGKTSRAPAGTRL